MQKQYFYGIYGIRFIWHGAYADPELIWHGKSFNYYDIENSLWSYYKEECTEEDKTPNEDDFAIWVKKHAHIARELLQNLMDNECFYN